MPLCFSLSQIPPSIVPLGFCRILNNASLFLSFSIKHIYILWLGVLSEKYFIFFLIALFAFNFLNFHGLHGCVCRDIFVYIRVGLGFSPLHVLVPWTYDPHRLWEWLARPCFLFMLLFFGRIERCCRKPTCITKLLSAHMREQVAALEDAGKLYHVFLKECWASHALKDLHEGTFHTGAHLVFLWSPVRRAIKISSPFSAISPQACVLALPLPLLLSSLSPEGPEPPEGFPGDTAMRSFGRICQNRAILGEGCRVCTRPCSKMVLFEAFHEHTCHQEQNVGKRLHSWF